MDSGIRVTHNEFTGRIGNGADFINDGQNGNDCDGHGTHVAGIVGGTTYGVAKNVTLHNVRVLGCDGSSSGSSVISGIDWVSTNRIFPAVVNMSLGGGYSTTLNNAVANSSALGITYVVSAGNENNDACDKSPASTPIAITVGSTRINDIRSSFSNYGVCVDVFGPGSQITSSSNSSDTGTVVYSGTSMASPNIAGIVARFLQNNPNATPAQVQNSIINSATSGVVIDPGVGSPNRLVFADAIFNNTTPLPPTPGPPPAVLINEIGIATPYPSEYVISRKVSPIGISPEDIMVKINGFSHTATGEVSLVLEGPTGAKILLQSGAGANEDANNISYWISDGGSSFSSTIAITNGSVYKPTANNLTNFPAPGPGSSYNNPGPTNGGTATLASTYGGTNPNGVWKLYVKDDGNGDRGRINSWDLLIRDNPPSSPSNLQATVVSDTQVNLSWNANPSYQNVVSYRVRVNGGTAINIGNVTSYTAVGLTSGVSHTFEVQAINSFGAESGWSSVSATTTGMFVPNPPTNISVAQLPFGVSNTLVVNWTNSTGNVVSYNVRVDGSRIVTGFTSSFASITGLNPNTTYSFEVQAVSNTGKTSIWSTPVSGKTPAGTPTPTPTPNPVGTYNAVNDFSNTTNPAGVWRYGLKTSPTTFTQYANNGDLVNGVRSWSENPNGGCCTMVAKNTTGAGLQYLGVINQPADVLNLHPGANGEKATVRWTAPTAGNFRLQGRFQGIDITGTSSDASILQNGAVIWSNNINGFGTVANYDVVIAVNVGDVVEFAVGYGSNNNYENDSTGVAINITKSTIASLSNSQVVQSPIAVLFPFVKEHKFQTNFFGEPLDKYPRLVNLDKLLTHRENTNS